MVRLKSSSPDVYTNLYFTVTKSETAAVDFCVFILRLPPPSAPIARPACCVPFLSVLVCVLQANIESEQSGDSLQQLQEEVRRLRQENTNLQVSAGRL